MSKPIRFTRHARQKFTDLAELGVVVSEAQVIEVVENPDQVDRDADPPIAQKSMSEHHVLRVVFAETADEFRVITFYPGKKDRYGSENAL